MLVAPPTPTTAGVSLGFDWPLVGAAQAAAVTAALARADLSWPGGSTHELEAATVSYLGTTHVIAHANGTSAMLSALYAAGVGPGTDVICPAYTWWASVAPARWLGAGIVFADIEGVNLTVDVDDVLARINTRTRAIVVPHLWGAAADVWRIVNATRGTGVTVIEDASHVFGTAVGADRLGTIADLGVFSLQANKPLPAGEGGLLVTNSAELFERGLAVGHYERLGASSVHDTYRGTGLGLKLRMSPLNAALALSYLDGLDDVLAAQDEMSRALVAPLEAAGVATAVGFQPGVRHGGRCAIRLIVDDGITVDEAVRHCAVAGLPAKPEYLRPLHQTPLMADGTVLPVTEGMQARLLHVSIPTSGTVEAAAALGTRIAGTLTGSVAA